MNWGYKIAITYSVFVLIILGLVYMSSQQNIDLVTEDYYEEELKYQQQIEKQNNTDKLKTPILLEQTKEQIVFQFPKELIGKNFGGSLYFYRPDDKAKDRTVMISVDENGIQKVNLSQFSNGYYKIKIEWKSGSTDYFQEEDLFV